MLIIDLIYFISVKAYIRGNKVPDGAFFISSLWISLLQLLWLTIFLFCIERCFSQKIISLYDNLKMYGFFLLILIAINNAYLALYNRKEKILIHFHLTVKQEKIYWALLIIVFFLSLIIAGRMSFLQKEMFSWSSDSKKEFQDILGLEWLIPTQGPINPMIRITHLSDIKIKRHLTGRYMA